MYWQEMQADAHGSAHAYVPGSPHLKHPQLVERLSRTLLEIVDDTRDSGLSSTVLDIGAGQGDFTVWALAAGCSVTATDMSRESIGVMEERFRANPSFCAVLDPEGSLAILDRARFSIILCSSVLHHIPDYLGFIEGTVLDHLEPGGTLFAFQDPLWYSRVGRVNRWASQAAYYAWRVTKGSYARGFSTVSRRIAGRTDESKEADMVEFHVVRQGVDEVAIEDALQNRFDRVEIGRYWSTQARSLQWMGERLNLQNTFFVRASGFHS
jgi:SAM-dependent methyltransferase